MAETKRNRVKRTETLATPKQIEKAQSIAKQELLYNPDVYDLPDSKYSLDQLSKHYLQVEENNKLILPKEKRRYVIYLRKSTDAEDRQVRSITDQKAECLLLANQLGITVREEDILEESESAKIAGKRPIFNKMLEGFLTSKYQGLLVWSPDRLSRNMKEAGEIIEMIDHELIQDLHFKTYQFENNPNGKMLLGILFATSKQYSDKLSVDVSRGVAGAVSDGKYLGVIKKGYYVDPVTKYFIPDGHNWQLLRKAVSMRLDEKLTNQEVAEFLNDSHFSYRKTADDEYKLFKFNKKTVSDLFNDPFYCGIYKWGDNISNLVELYNFLPLVTAEEHIKLSREMSDNFDEEFGGRGAPAQRLGFGLLREKVICDYCDSIMTFQRTKIPRGKNEGRYMLSFYCRNKDCIRHNNEKAIKEYGKKLSKSVRMKYITPHIAWTIQNCTKDSKKAYDYYIDRLSSELAIKREIAKRKLSDEKSEIKKQEEMLAQYQNFQVTNPDEYKKFHKGKLEEHHKLLNLHTHNKEKLESELEKLNQKLPTRKEFVELVQSYLETLRKTRDIIEENEVYKEVVLNLRVADNTVSVIKLNPPYNLMVDLQKVPYGRGERT